MLPAVVVRFSPDAVATRCPSDFMDDVTFSHNGPYNGMSIPLPIRRCSVVRMLTPLLRRIGCFVSQTTAGACDAPLRCYQSCTDLQLFAVTLAAGGTTVR